MDLVSVFGENVTKRLTGMNILLVGAGGIGCEVLKNLVILDIRKISVVRNQHEYAVDIRTYLFFLTLYRLIWIPLILVILIDSFSFKDATLARVKAKLPLKRVFVLCLTRNDPNFN